MRRLGYMPFILLALMFVFPFASHADGIIIPRPRPGRPAPPLQSLAIEYHRVTVSIEEGVATTRVDQVFRNDSAYDMEGDYVFPLPDGASVSSFAMWVDGQRLEAQTLDADEAREIYEAIVRQQKDPALLEYAGRGAFRARIYPIPARGEKRVQLEYSEVLPRETERSGAAVWRYVYPLNTDKFSTEPLREASVTVDVRARATLNALYSPSHEVDVTDRKRTSAGSTARVVYREEGVVPDTDFVLYIGTGEDNLGVNVISHKPTGEDGYLLMLVTPSELYDEAVTVARDVVLVLDVSGSMRGDKLDQAKGAARYVLDNLGDEDRYNVVAFGSGTRVLAPHLLSAKDRARGRSFVQELSAGGGTNIQRAMLEALDLLDAGRPQLILFMTDGLPTEGEVRVERILSQVKDAATADARVFAFGVGYDVNTTLLDTLSQDHGGTTVYVRPEESIERAVSSFYDKIGAPVLANVRLSLDPLVVEELYPYPLPDLFAGEQLVVVGRYRRGGTCDLVLEGTVNGRAVRLTYADVRLRTGEAAAGAADFIPRLWATRKVGYLLTQIRLHGADDELVDEVIALGTRYGIVTPYTSFLVDETEDRSPVLQPKRPPLRGGGSGSGGAEAPERSLDHWSLPAPMAASESVGKAAVDNSIAQKGMREAESVADVNAQGTRAVGSKTFRLERDMWVDTAYDVGRHDVERVGFGSDAYFALAATVPDAGRYLALGPRVLFVHGDRAYEVTPEGSATDASVSPTATPTEESQGGHRWLTDVGLWFRGILKR